MTEAFRAAPGEALARVSSRRSCDGGRVWAKPHELERSIRAARARARIPNTRNTSDNDALTAVLLILKGNLGQAPEELLVALMTALAQRSAVPLHRSNSSCVLQNNTWAEVWDGGDTWAGSVRIQLNSVEAVHRLHDTVRHYVVDLYGVRRHLELHGPALSAAGSQPPSQPPSAPGNGGGAGR